ncbi:MAG: Hsp20/alpha crystallin family protein [Bacteroidetes bacterium]|nr:MAG: Hsp20/alpha crystallin family protein [Bacteroidota bacterium]
MNHIMRTAPIQNFRNLHRELDRQVSSIFPSLRYFDTPVWNDFARDHAPKLDVVETDNAFQLTLDLPGIQKDDIEISLHEGILTIRGERAERVLEDSETSLRSERFTGTFSRAFKMPTEIVEKDIAAKLDNGVLVVDLPKAEESKPQSIKIS